MGPSPTPTAGQTNGTEIMFVAENLIPESTYTCLVTAVADATPGGSASDSFRTTTPGVCVCVCVRPCMCVCVYLIPNH